MFSYSETIVIIHLHTRVNDYAHKNQYAFVNNNPVNFIDPYGLCSPDKSSWYEKPFEVYDAYQQWRRPFDQWMNQNVPGFQRFGELMESPGVQYGMMFAMGSSSTPPGLNNFGRSKHLFTTQGKDFALRTVKTKAQPFIPKAKIPKSKVRFVFGKVLELLDSFFEGDLPPMP